VSAEKSPGRLLIIEHESNLVDNLQQHFEMQGYEVLSALTCRRGLDLAQTARPNLILLAARMPDMAGLDAFRALRDQPRTGHIPVMIMAGHDEAILQNKVLEEGAYDFLEKPLDLDILTLRVRNALRRAEREGLSEPRTGLPTGRLVDERLDALGEERGWYKIELTIASFNVFRDRYGFVTANEALRFAGNLILQLVNEYGRADDFVGHVSGSERFVILTTLVHGPALRGVLARRVTEELESFYTFVEREQGYVQIEDGAGGYYQKPLMSAQVTVMQGEPDPNAPDPGGDPWEDAADDESGRPDKPASGPPLDW
jgi:DNA-binding response OmpR family regulator